MQIKSSQNLGPSESSLAVQPARQASASPRTPLIVRRPETKESETQTVSNLVKSKSCNTWHTQKIDAAIQTELKQLEETDAAIQTSKDVEETACNTVQETQNAEAQSNRTQGQEKACNREQNEELIQKEQINQSQEAKCKNSPVKEPRTIHDKTLESIDKFNVMMRDYLNWTRQNLASQSNSTENETSSP